MCNATNKNPSVELEELEKEASRKRWDPVEYRIWLGGRGRWDRSVLGFVGSICKTLMVREQ